MKALIVTIKDCGFNYGNKLQNYAVKKILEKYNYSVDTLCFEYTKREEILTYIKLIFHRFTGYRFVKNKKYWLEYTAFRKFDSHNIPTVYIENPKDVTGYDLYVVGSDQVWNAKWYQYKPVRKDFYLLDFDDGAKKICMAPSFGIDRLPDEWIPFFKKKLPEFKHISVREEKGAEIVRDLTGLEATVLVDPTMLLTREEWSQIAHKPKNIKTDKGYILTYFLGGRTPKVELDLENIAKNNNLKVFNLMDKNNPNLWEIGPSEFVYLLSKASLIMTDSFHASVFSFLFSKPFLVYSRSGTENDMLSRLNTLLNKFDLQDKYVSDQLPVDIFGADYRSGYKKLELEREKARDFIEQSLRN